MAQRHIAKNPRDSDNYLVKVNGLACVSHITIVEVTRMVARAGARRQRSAIGATIATHLNEIPDALSALHEAPRIDRAGIRARGGGVYLQRLNHHRRLIAKVAL